MRCIRMLAVAALVACAAAPAVADDYPSRPIRLLIHTPPGSLVDVLGRLIGQELGDRLGQSLVVDTRPGGATMIAVEQLRNSPADGYTLMVNTSEATMLPFLKKSYRFDPIKDFTPIALAVTSWTVFAVNPAVPVNTLQELVAYSKSHAGGVRYGSGGTGGVLHIAVEMLKLKSGGNFVHVPYRGGAQAATDAIAGQIEMVSMGLASTRVADGGKLKILAQTGPSRHPMLPDVPTTAEVGLPDVRMDTWFGLVGPPGLSPEIVTRINRELAIIVKQQAFQDKLAKLGLAVDYRPGDKFIRFMADDTKRWRELIPAMGIPQVD
ncbi:Bug family tripartite tricarboxylate transporter substrate binding protein [Rhodoplanes sp. Z2-YC6860]|uniref:Bug family tripartite tricarboxylate transporter substrate binding protein n=1 Tax=Rhodoplanes sp. Z2-YC6860 TaxID=674703 RepID=UPI00078DEF23|nr:tripartite tricarboxylate transporter substrate binding protein [Rhodoplanes sp. Z2-YC6860]AMN38535.1 extra-cytoplasmic solute receptor protein [Rhodoplanes sp. Z2-YC6860]